MLPSRYALWRIRINSIAYSSFGNAIWALFISDICSFFGCLRNLLSYIIFRIQICRFLNIQKSELFPLVFLMRFMNKELVNTSIILKQRTNLLKFVQIQTLLLIILFIFGKIFDGKHHISQFNHVANNYPFVPLLWFNDHGFIWGVGVGCENESIDLGRSYFNNSINISLCFFSRSLTFTGNGGVVFVSGGSYSMNINNSMFYNCSCRGDGGAIFFYSFNSNLRMICVYRCSASHMYHSAYIQASQVNFAEYLSLSSCSFDTAGDYSLRLYYGNQNVNNINNSLNKANMVSGILIASPSSFTSTHCTFSNNKVSDCNCIYFYSESGAITMSYTNIVHNNSPSRFGIVFVNGAGPKQIIYCIFHKNHNYLFCEYGGSLEVSHSFIDHSSSSFYISTSVSTDTNNSFTFRMTYQIQFFNSLHCHTDIPERTQEQSQDVNRSHMPWIAYLVVLLLFVTLLGYLFFYRRIANNLLARNTLEDSLQYDYG